MLRSGSRSSCCDANCVAGCSSFVWLYRLFPAVTRAMLIIRPDTLVRWHRAGFRRYWSWKFVSADQRWTASFVL